MCNYLTINSQFFHNFKIELGWVGFCWVLLGWVGIGIKIGIGINTCNYLTINSQFFHNFKIELLIIEALRWAGNYYQD